MSTSKKPLVDEDVDDLDDVVDEFSAPPPAPAPAKSAAGKAPAAAPAPAADELEEEAFARELAEGMEALMRELGGGAAPAGAPSARGGTKPDNAALHAAWEQLLVEGMGGPQGAAAAEAGRGKDAARDSAEDAFSRTIQEAMARMKVSEDTLQADAQAGAGAGDPLSQLLASLGDLGGEGGEGEQNDDDLQGMLENMMSQLMSKEILYDPLKELGDKFPGWLDSHRATLTDEEKKRYEAQQVCTRKILAIFEQPGYSDDNTESAAQIMTLMNEMQSHGSPPADLMGPLPSGFETGPDGLPKLPEGCLIS